MTAADEACDPEAPAQAHPLGPDGFTPLVSNADYRAAFHRVLERCEELKTQVAEHRWNALEMARRADLAERRAEESEYHVEQLRDARDRAERQAEDAEAAIEATELDRRLAAERALVAVMQVVEEYESCGPKQQSTRDVLAAVRAAAEGGRK